MISEIFAKELAAETLNIVESTTDPASGSLNVATTPLVKNYTNGSVSSVVSEGLALRDRIHAAGPFAAWSTVIPHPTKKRIIIEMVAPHVVQGAEQRYLVCAGRVFDLTKNEMCLIETSLHTEISHHALKRLYMRADFDKAELLNLMDSATAFACPFLHAVLHFGWPPGTGIAIPFLGGLLLGAAEPNPLAAGEGPSFGLLSRGKFSEMTMLDLPFGSNGDSRGIAKISIETYVGPNELFPNQILIQERLAEIRDEFSSEFREMRSGLMRGYPDPRMIKRFGKITTIPNKDNLLEMGEIMLRFFHTPEWARQAEAHGQRASAIRRRGLN